MAHQMTVKSAGAVPVELDGNPPFVACQIPTLHGVGKPGCKEVSLEALY